MGCVVSNVVQPVAVQSCSKSATARAQLATSNRVINAQIKVEKSKELRQTRLLLLGAAESGKSTVLKQFRLVNGEKFSPLERAHAKKAIYRNVFDSCLELAKHARLLSKNDERYKVTVKGLGPLVRRYLEADKADVSKRQSLQLYRPDLAMIQVMTELWRQPGVQLVFKKHRFELQVQDSVAYFLDERHTDLMNPDYEPNDMDMLQVRAETCGVTEVQIDSPEATMNIIDVGGQRSERRKWVALFDQSITAILFVVALTGYAQRLAEDRNVIRLHEAIEVFESVMTRQGFDEVNVILFLNKRDIFEQQIKEIPLTTCFNEYDGDPHDYDQSTTFIRSKFEHINEQRNNGKEMYSHITCATDQDAMGTTLLAVQHIMISNLVRTAF